ncbi:hypothetical protein AAXB25_22810 [Paenibacillus lautus]|uniref:hypothetical protein n=1 Tax=Paenibacillus lautus TaxID=1401 RepID=UPI003D2CBA1D
MTYDDGILITPPAKNIGEIEVYDRGEKYEYRYLAKANLGTLYDWSPIVKFAIAYGKTHEDARHLASEKAKGNW